MKKFSRKQMFAVAQVIMANAFLVLDETLGDARRPDVSEASRTLRLVSQQMCCLALAFGYERSGWPGDDCFVETWDQRVKAWTQHEAAKVVDDAEDPTYNVVNVHELAKTFARGVALHRRQLKREAKMSKKSRKQAKEVALDA